MGSSNIGLWKALNIHIENTSFKHKITNQNIYVFADVPHLLKLARNHLIVKYKLAHKFPKKHLLVEGILVTNISLKNVLIDIKNMNGLTYTITRKLNHDILENLFSFLKGMAGCASNNITASDFKCCLRWFILGKHSHSVFSENTNIEDGHKDKLLNDCKCITSDLFYNLKLSEEICNDQLETESHNTCLKETDIPELHFDLLKQFEVCIS
ncbi:hypothetical protein QTP88_023619 [Uroleucon formosanum]